MYLYLFEIDKYIHLQLLLYLSKICVCICLKLYNCFIARRRDSQNLVEFSEKLQCCMGWVGLGWGGLYVYVALFREI